MNDIDDNIIELDSNPLDSLSQDNEITLQQILNNLLDGKRNLELKSHVFKPKKIATLKVIANHLESIDYKLSAKLIKDFVKFYLELMISYNREGRKEIIRAFMYSNIRQTTGNELGNALD